MDEDPPIEPELEPSEPEIADPDAADVAPDAEIGSPRTGLVLVAAGLLVWAGWAYIKWGDRPDFPPAAVAEADSAAPAESATESVPAIAETAPAVEEEPPEDSAPVEPIEVNPDWAEELEAPDTVAYTVRHGGTLENVANLYKIFITGSRN